MESTSNYIQHQPSALQQISGNYFSIQEEKKSEKTIFCTEFAFYIRIKSQDSMKRLSILLLFTILCVQVWSQAVPRFKKYDIAETGCKVYLPADPGDFEKTLSEDKSEVYTAESVFDEFNFAVILVKFSEPIGNDKDVNTDMVTSYLDFLQTQFGVTEAAGYGLGHTLESAPEAVGVIDYWEDSNGIQYAVKSWCDGDFLAVLMLYGKDEYPIFNAQEMFLNGFRFPEE